MTRLLLALAVGGCAARQIPPEDIEEGLPPWRTRGEEVRLEIAEQLLATSNTRGSLQIIRQMRSEGYDTPELDLLQGIALRKDGLVSEAQRLLEDAQEAMPRDARPWSELCVLHAEERQVEEAIAHCERATRLDEGNARAWNNLAFLLLSVDRVEEAGAAAEQAVRLDGAEPRFRNNLALTQVARGRAELGFRTFSSTLPAHEAAYNVGLAVERFQSYEAARAWYVRALQGDPEHEQARLKLEPSVAPTPAGPAPDPSTTSGAGPASEEEL